MQRKTEKIELPESKVSIDINLWITGREKEYAEEPIYGAMQMTGQMMNGAEMDIKGIDAKQAVQESAHRDIEVYVTCVYDEEKQIKDQKEILEFILNQIPDEDYTFIGRKIAEIKNSSKKK